MAVPFVDPLGPVQLGVPTAPPFAAVLDCCTCCGIDRALPLMPRKHLCVRIICKQKQQFHVIHRHVSTGKTS